jgi:hypothetical protein
VVDYTSKVLFYKMQPKHALLKFIPLMIRLSHVLSGNKPLLRDRPRSDLSRKVPTEYQHCTKLKKTDWMRDLSNPNVDNAIL